MVLRYSGMNSIFEFIKKKKSLQSVLKNDDYKNWRVIYLCVYFLFNIL